MKLKTKVKRVFKNETRTLHGTAGLLSCVSLGNTYKDANNKDKDLILTYNCNKKDKRKEAIVFIQEV